MALQGVAAASILPAQLQPAVLTVIAFHMVVSVHGHHTDGGLTALCREDRTGTGGTLWCKNRVVISDTVDVVLHVHSEGYPVQALVAHRAPEAAWVVGLPKGLKDHLHDEVSTHATLVSRLLEPGVLGGDTGSRVLHDKRALAAQPTAASWPRISM